MIKRDKFVIQPGKICTFDKDNLMKQNEDGIIFVEVVKKCKRTSLFGPTFWYIKGACEDENKLKDPIPVPETLLHPEGMCVIRFPSDYPIINSNDINSLHFALRYILESNNDFTIKYDKEHKHQRRLSALIEKLNFYYTMKEI